MDLTATKAVVLVLLGLIKLCSGLAPIVFTKILKRKSDRFLKKFIGIVLCFGGGVLLSTVLLHMVREVRESIARATALAMLPGMEEYPFAELLIGLGFLLILLIESVVHKFFGGHGHSHFPSQETLAKKFVAVEDVRSPGVDNIGYEASVGSPRHSPDHVPSVYSVTPRSLASSDTDSSSATSEAEARAEKRLLSSLRSFLVVIALSVHSLFEGMAIGLEETDTGVWKLLMAVSIHAVPIVFCVGTDMISSGVKKVKMIVYMIVLSINTPIGILIGILVTIHMENATGQHVLLIGVLQGLAAGTLLYITFFEVLARDKLGRYGMSGLVGALAVMLGFSVMAGLEVVGGHSHGGHGHGAALLQQGQHLHSHDHGLTHDHGHDHNEDHHDHGGHSHQHDQNHKHEDHDHHDHNDHDHHDDHNDHDHHHQDGEHGHKMEPDFDPDNVTANSADYFEFNVTDYKFMHDNVAYD